MENPLKNLTEKVHCVCTRLDGLFMPSRQLSMVLAAFLLVLFLSFMGGYFLGKKHIVDDFVLKVEQDSFADQIYSSLCLLGDQDPEVLRAERDEAEEQEDQQVAQGESSELSQGAAASQTALLDVTQEQEEKSLENNETIVKKPAGKQYYAQLVGFGSATAAQKFAAAMNKKKLPVRIKERESVSGKGKRKVWYQVVTQAFSDRNLLADLVDRIAKEGKIKGVQILAC